MTHDPREDFQQYRRKQIAELRPWKLGDDMAGISISGSDYDAGSPKYGDMIARNPKNHTDQWLVAAAYFADNFEALSASAPKGCPALLAAVLRSRGRNNTLHDINRAADMLERTSPPPAAGWDEATNWLEGIANNDGNADQHVARRAVELLKSGQALRCDSPAPSGVADSDLDAEISALAHRFWSIHPSSLDDMGLTREQFYAQEITKLIKASRPDAGGGMRALRLLAAEDERQSKLHDLLETIREQIRLEVPPERRPDGLFKNIQDAVYAMRGRTPLMNDATIVASLSTPSDAVNASAEARLRGGPHTFVPAKEGYGQFCAECGYGRNETLQHFRPDGAGGDEAKKSEGGAQFIEGYFTDQYAAGAKPPVGPSSPTTDRREIVARPTAFLAWAVDMFGPIAKLRSERLMRFVEEAIELAHAESMDRGTLIVITDRVYSRPPGDTRKETGQAQACLEMFAENIGLSSADEAELEFQRVQSIPRDEWQRRHSAKQAIGIAALDGGR